MMRRIAHRSQGLEAAGRAPQLPACSSCCCVVSRHSAGVQKALMDTQSRRHRDLRPQTGRRRADAGVCAQDQGVCFCTLLVVPLRPGRWHQRDQHGTAHCSRPAVVTAPCRFKVLRISLTYAVATPAPPCVVTWLGAGELERASESVVLRLPVETTASDARRAAQTVHRVKDYQLQLYHSAHSGATPQESASPETSVAEQLLTLEGVQHCVLVWITRDSFSW
jgi:hypothetical protein